MFMVIANLRENSQHLNDLIQLLELFITI